jgi:hypothetical protein
MWKKYQTTLAIDVCAFTAAKSRLEHDPEPKWRRLANWEPVSPREPNGLRLRDHVQTKR